MNRQDQKRTRKRRIQIPRAQVLRRSAELDEIRRKRPLTEAEYAEADDLAHRVYMIAWRDEQNAVERRLAGAGK
ncbi:MAG: hypothetical protein R3E21_08075 [Caenibius sp.]